MGKSWKEKPDKYKYQINKNKKNTKSHKSKPDFNDIQPERYTDDLSNS
jgi:hypothetical protein